MSRPFRAITLAAALALLTTAPAVVSARDLGTHGRVWPVTERDFREEFVKAAEKVNWGEIQDGLRKDAETWLDRRPAYEMGKADTSATTWLDLTYILDRDIQIPEFDVQTGEYYWVMLYPKGTVVNPLDYQRPHDAMVFFDARDPQQLEMVQRLIAPDPYRWMLIQSAGNPEKTAQRVGRPVFHLDPLLTERFQVRKVPAIVFAGNGEHRRLYGKTYLAAPYTEDDLRAVRELAFPGSTAALATGSTQ